MSELTSNEFTIRSANHAAHRIFLHSGSHVTCVYISTICMHIICMYIPCTHMYVCTMYHVPSTVCMYVWC